MPPAMLATTIAGSLPKPAWLAAPRTLWAPWLLDGPALDEGKRDAVILALRDQEDAGIHIVTDGEQTRRHFVWGFVEQIEGIDFSKMVTIGIRADRYRADVPTVVAPVRRRRSIHSDEVRFARAQSRRPLKWTMPGPMTIVDTIYDAHYRSRARLGLELARLINEEARELEALGVDVIQLDEPAFNVYMDEVRDWGIEALDRAVAGLTCRTAVTHVSPSMARCKAGMPQSVTSSMKTLKAGSSSWITSTPSAASARASWFSKPANAIASSTLSR